MPADAKSGEACQNAADQAPRDRCYEEFLQSQLAELGQRLLWEYRRAGADAAERRDPGADAAAGADVRVEEVGADALSGVGVQATSLASTQEAGAGAVACTDVPDPQAHASTCGTPTAWASRGAVPAGLPRLLRAPGNVPAVLPAASSATLPGSAHAPCSGGPEPDPARPAQHGDPSPSASHAVILSASSCAAASLSDDEQPFGLLPAWRRKAGFVPSRSISGGVLSPRARAAGDSIMDDDDEDDDMPMVDVPPSGFWSHVMMMPSWPGRICWDCISIILVSYECVMLPLLLMDIVFNQMAWFTRLFWTVDMPLSMITGYMRPEGTVEMRPRHVCGHYLKSWFVIDAVTLAVDWMEIFIGDATGDGSANAARMGKVLKSLRMIRMLRFSRATRMQFVPNVMKFAVHRFRSDLVSTIFSLGKIVLLLVWINHVIACCWHYQGSDDGWLVSPANDFSQKSLQYRYTTSYHWSLTQFGVGGMEVHPVNTEERVFNIVVLVFAFVVAVYIASSVTTHLTRVAVATSSDSNKMRVVSDFLYENKISHGLIMRVQRNAKHALLEQRRTRPSIELLTLLSEPLRLELHFEVHSPAIRSHPLFRRYADVNKTIMMEVCHRAIARLYLTRSDALFVDGDVPTQPRMYFVKDGCFAYVQNDASMRLAKEVVTAGQWFCEATLWTSWVHQGSMSARRASNLLSLDSEAFQRLLTPVQASDPSIRNYAVAFVAQLNDPCRRLTDLSDQDMDLAQMAADACPPIIIKRVTFDIRKLNPRSSDVNYFKPTAQGRAVGVMPCGGAKPPPLLQPVHELRPR